LNDESSNQFIFTFDIPFAVVFQRMVISDPVVVYLFVVDGSVNANFVASIS